MGRSVETSRARREARHDDIKRDSFLPAMTPAVYDDVERGSITCRKEFGVRSVARAPKCEWPECGRSLFRGDSRKLGYCHEHQEEGAIIKAGELRQRALKRAGLDG